MRSLYLLCLDRHHLGDELFLKSLAQHIAEAGPDAPPCVLVHGSGEKVERTLEAQGYFPERTEGLLDVEDEEQRRLVERAVREVNQDIVATLTDEVVSTVGIQGVDRGLLQRTSEGALRASNAGWVEALLKQRIVPVVSALVEAPDTGAVHEVQTGAAVQALGRAFETSFDPVACAFTTADTAGLPDEEGRSQSEVKVGAVSEEQVPDSFNLRRLVDAGMPVLVTNPEGLFAGEEVQGTQVRS